MSKADNKKILQNNDTMLLRWLGFAGHFWVLPVAYYFYILGQSVTNTPYGDDIDLIVGNTAYFLSASDFWSKLPYLFTQSAGYQTIFITLSGILSTYIFGYINFTFITLFGNLVLFAGMFIFVVNIARDHSEFNLIALIAFTFLATPVHAECMVWANCTLGHYGAIFIGALTCFFLTRQGLIFFILFEIGLVLAIFTHGNGIMMMPLGFLGIWLFQNKQNRKIYLWTHLAICIFATAIGLATLDKGVYSALEAGGSQTLSTPLSGLWNVVAWIVGWFGSWAAINDNLNLALIAGVIELLVIGWIFFNFKSRIFDFYPHASLLIVYLIMTIAGAALSRSLLLEASYVLTDRYKLYSLCLAIFVISVLIMLVKDKKLFYKSSIFRWERIATIVVVLSIFYNLTINSREAQGFVAEKNQRLRCAAEWHEKREAMSCMWHGENKTRMDKAEEMQILYIDQYGSEPLSR